MNVLQVKTGRVILVALIIICFLTSCAFIFFERQSVQDTRVPSAVFRDGVLGNFEPDGRVSSLAESPQESPDPQKLVENIKSMGEYGMNIAASDQMPLDRDVPDIRHPECRYWHYPSKLPTTSVVIVFYNEGLSILQRTVVSVVNRSPPQFLKEVVLVDDFSNIDDLKDKLSAWVRDYGNGRVRLIRNKQREGLIRSRTFGAQEARGRVVLFLDAHCEVNVNWLPPLLAPIHSNRTVMTVPVIDGIDYKTLEYRSVYEDRKNFRGIFEWGMLYKEKELPEELTADRKHHSQPYKSPTHAGGLFAIDRDFFFKLGAYDPGLLIWGGENFELSFKVWQCGGSVEWVPCSRVGHIYRGPRTAAPEPVITENRNGGFNVLANYRRVVEVWMDDYKEYFYTREPLARQYDMGDISSQLQLRDSLKCKSFEWFMHNVAPDLLQDFPLLPRNLYWGQLRNPQSKMCLDVVGDIGCQAWPCHGGGGNQLFRLNAAGQLGTGERCIDSDGERIIKIHCQLGRISGPWSYRQDSKTLYHNGHEKCLEHVEGAGHPKLELCKEDADEQTWLFEEILVHQD